MGSHLLKNGSSLKGEAISQPNQTILFLKVMPHQYLQVDKKN